jgi:hypothetical protein
VTAFVAADAFFTVVVVEGEAPRGLLSTYLLSGFSDHAFLDAVVHVVVRGLACP